VSHAVPPPLVPLARAWQGAVRVPRRRAILAGVALVVVASLLLARAGTLKARCGAAGAVVAVAVLLAVVGRREARVWGDPRRTIERVASRVDPERAARAQRALGLLAAGGGGGAGRGTPDDGTSPVLAELHVHRSLSALPAVAIQRGAQQVALRFAVTALLLALGVLGIAVVFPWSVLEGLDVLVARHRIAPVPMTWLDEAEVHARPPDYLHQNEVDDLPFGELALPRGTLISYIGVAVHAGRQLALTDGSNEVPFVDDGKGHILARWPLTDSVSLRVVARFGDVAIPEGDVTRVMAIPDEKPLVELEGAPKRIELARDEDASEIPVRYQATDDHGLREVHLVLRSGTREERRVLAKLDGDTRHDEGGHVLRATDPFIKKSHVPVEIRVEAKDNDPITGPKWGASEAITVVPPDVGEPQAMRVEGLRKLRDRFVDSLGWRMEHPVPRAGSERKGMLAEEGKTVDDDADLLDATTSEAYAGARVPGRLQALLRGQMRKVREAMTQEGRVASPQTHATLVKASERITLVTDAILRGLGERDSRAAAKQLADVADDVSLGETQEARGADEKERGRARVDAGVGVLVGGARSLVRLGDLGRDVGEIIHADLSRVNRGNAANDFAHAELAARDLAARLREPDPSFGAQGGAQRGGGEAGGGKGTPGDEEDSADEVYQAFNEAAQDLEQLAHDHADEMAKVQNDLSGAANPDDAKSMNDEAKKHAEKVREAVRDLPNVGAGSESSSGKSAAAHEQAEQMARALEEGSPADAVSSGRSALQTLDEAKRAAENEPWRRWNNQPSQLGHQIDDARKKLEAEVSWADQKVAEMRKKAAERAHGKLSEDGNAENGMAQRARELGNKGSDQMPGAALDALEEAEKSMNRASDELHAGDPDKAMAQQQEAQRQLEMAQEAMGSHSEGDEGDEGRDGQPGGDDGALSRERTKIPNADEHKGPEDFRRRVTEGLSQPSSGKLKDAVRRYAEGLLR
jgi:hypothetical protein